MNDKNEVWVRVQYIKIKTQYYSIPEIFSDCFETMKDKPNEYEPEIIDGYVFYKIKDTQDKKTSIYLSLMENDFENNIVLIGYRLKSLQSNNFKEYVDQDTGETIKTPFTIYTAFIMFEDDVGAMMGSEMITDAISVLVHHTTMQTHKKDFCIENWYDDKKIRSFRKKKLKSASYNIKELDDKDPPWYFDKVLADRLDFQITVKPKKNVLIDPNELPDDGLSSYHFEDDNNGEKAVVNIIKRKFSKCISLQINEESSFKEEIKNLLKSALDSL